MAANITRVLAAGVALAVLLQVGTARCNAGAWWNPFSSGKNEKKLVDGTSTSKKAPPKTTKASPTLAEKITAGPKNLATKISNTLTGKKPQQSARKKNEGIYAYPQNPIQPQKKSSSLVPSFFKPAEPERDQTVPDWMNHPRVGETPREVE
jgi:hypothetical protein